MTGEITLYVADDDGPLVTGDVTIVEEAVQLYTEWLGLTVAVENSTLVTVTYSGTRRLFTRRNGKRCRNPRADRRGTSRCRQVIADRRRSDARLRENAILNAGDSSKATAFRVKSLVSRLRLRTPRSRTAKWSRWSGDDHHREGLTMAPDRTAISFANSALRGFEARKPTRSSTRAFSRYTILTRSFGGRRFSPASRRIAPRTRFPYLARIDASSEGRRKAKRQHAQGFWRGWSKLCSRASRSDGLSRCKRLARQTIPRCGLSRKLGMVHARSKRGPAHAWFGRVRAFAPTPYEGGTNWPIGSVASQTERLRFSGLYSREKVAPGNFDWDSH